MGIEKEKLIKMSDYTTIVSRVLYSIDAVMECPYCHIEYLTGKEEGFIYGIVTNEFKKLFGENGYDNGLMRQIIKQYLDERMTGHVCDSNDD